MSADPKPSDHIIIAYGPQPIEFLGKAAAFCGHDAVIDSDLGRNAGATFVVGSPRALDALAARLAHGAMATAIEETSGTGISHEAISWLANGERGLSSETMFAHLIGISVCGPDGQSHPYDCSDWRRCQLLLEAVPEVAQRFPKMAEVSPQWANLISAWPEILMALDEDSPDWRKKTSWGHSKQALNLIRTAIGRGHLIA